MTPICRSFLPEDLHPLLKSAEIDQSIFVQTQHSIVENRWALELAERYGFLCGVVGWVDLTSHECEAQLLQFKEHPLFVGIRHVVQDEPDDDFIVRDDVRNGLAVLEKYQMPYDLLFYDRHLKHAATVAHEFPSLPLVIDHLSKPAIKSGVKSDGFLKWKAELKAAAECENVFCKVSGMVTEADWTNWTVDDLRPWFEWALECFEPDRLMYGSDWPVCELAATYEQVHSATSELISSLSPAEQQKIMGDTAQSFYSLRTA